MHPVLFEIGGVPVRGYAVAVLLAFIVASLVRRSEVKRLGYARDTAHAVVGIGALVGAIVGAKLGMVMFQPFEDWWAMLMGVVAFDLTGKTVMGGLAGGYLGVEIAKKVAGVRHSTGDGWAVALPMGQAVGRVGCFLEGCCYGTPWTGPWSVEMGGVHRHPTQLYEAGLDLGLAALLFAFRKRTGTHGQLFRAYLVGYAIIRFSMEPLRGDPSRWLGPLTLVQVVCVLAALALGTTMVIKARSAARLQS